MTNENQGRDIEETVVEDDESFQARDREAVIKKLKHELSECKKERDEYLGGWQRAKADFINAHRADERSREEFAKFSRAGILEELLDIAAVFDRAFNGADAEDSYIKGFSRIHNELTKLLERNGVAVIESLGMPFNAALHEAVGTKETEDEHRDGIILEELERGFTLHGKVIKPAKVKVGEFRSKKQEL